MTIGTSAQTDGRRIQEIKMTWALDRLVLYAGNV
jgi:hypothetical protein